jgi:serine/threonine protein kinase
VEDSSENLSVGERFGPYEVESALGQGGMGHVYRARGPEGEVALKLIKRDLAADQTFRRRFDREARIAQQVVHPNVVPVLATGEHEGVPYLAQRFVGNDSLADRLRRDGALDLVVTVDVCEQVASGLDALHASGLIHRDVKPGNILLDDAGTAYISDFGLAKDTGGTVLTKPGQALGSLDYMAPEQIRGEGVGPAADVYALGCVLWECLSGAPPFADRKGMRILWAHLQDEPESPCAKRADLPTQVGDAVLRALAKEPEERPQSASAYARLVRAAAG